MNASGDKALQFCERPVGQFQIALLFGDDPGVVEDAASTLIRSWSEKAGGAVDVRRIQEDDIKKEPALLFDAISAISLLGEKQIIRLRITGEAIAKTLQAVADEMNVGTLSAENFLVVEAPSLTKKSKVRMVFSTSAHMACLHVFSDSEAQVKDLVREKLAQSNIQIADDALELFSSELPGDRRLANSEIEKLSLFALDFDRPLGVDDVRSISFSEQPRDAADAADAALSGNAKRAFNSIDRFLDSGGAPVSALRTLHFRLSRIVDAKSGAKFLRPPVFDNERPAFNRMIARWNARSLSSAFSLLYSAEKTCKRGGAPAEAVLKIVIDRISRALT